MIQLTNTDLLIIKQSQGWASRSISKLKSFTDRRHGRDLRSVIDKAVNVRDKCGDVWDDLASRTLPLDKKAITEFTEIRITFSSIKNHIERLVIPNLLKENVDIVKYYKEREAEREKINKPPEDQPNKPKSGKSKPQAQIKEEEKQFKKSKQEIKEYIQTLMAEILASPVVPELFADRNATEKQLAALINEIDQDIPFENLNELKDKANAILQQYKNNLAANINIEKKESERLTSLIKNALNTKTATYYYLLALAKYGPIKTPLKSTWTNIKQYIPFAGESSDIHSYRKEAIDAAKELRNFSKEFIVTIQKAISTTEQLSKWVSIIDKYNEFVDLYNSKINFFANMHEAYLLKSRSDEMLKRKKNKTDKSEEYGYSMDYDWRDMPSLTRGKFKSAEKIEF